MDFTLRQRNLSDCKDGAESCDRSKLTSLQVSEVLAAEHQRNVWNCENGWDQCDRSKLTDREAVQIAASEHQRNVLAGTDGGETCDYSSLSTAETTALAKAEHKCNYDACTIQDIAIPHKCPQRRLLLSSKHGENPDKVSEQMDAREAYDQTTVSRVRRRVGSRQAFR